jgi:hypothetical protein
VSKLRPSCWPVSTARPLWDELLSQVPVPKEIREYAKGLKIAATQKQASTKKASIGKTATTKKAA